jgi:hypothetical protein
VRPQRLIGSLLATTLTLVGGGWLDATPASASTLVSGIVVDTLGDDGAGQTWPTSLHTPTFQVVTTVAGTSTTFRTTTSSHGTLTGPSVTVTPPTGSTELAVGDYVTAGVAGAGVAGLTINGSTCPAQGTLSVHEASYSAGALVAFAATYSFRCLASSGLAYGELRYQSALDITSAQAPVTSGTPRTIVGTSTSWSVAVLNTGTVPLLPGAAQISGPSAAEFAVTDDGCAGSSVGLLSSCSLTVTATPAARGARTAVLHVPDGTARGERTVPLWVEGLTAPSAPQSLTAVAASDGITVDWAAPADDGGAGVNGYQVWRAAPGEQQALLATVSARHYGDRLSASTTGATAYTYEVRAFNGAGTSVPSGSATATTPAAALVPTSTGVVVSEPGGIGYTTTDTVLLTRAAGATVTGTAQSWGPLSVNAQQGPAAGISLMLTPPTGQRFALGSYSLGPEGDATHATALLGVKGAGCSSASGTVDVQELALDSDATLQVLALELTYTCMPGGPTHRMVARIGTDATYSAVQIPALDAGQVLVGSPITVPSTFTNLGTQDVTVTAVAVTDPAGSPSTEWAVGSGTTCAGVTLTPGTTCTTDLVVTASAAAATQALVHYTHTGPAGSHTRTAWAVGASLPLQVSGLVASRAGGMVTLHWSDLGSPSSRATSWQVWAGGTADSLALLATTDLRSFTDPDTTSSVRYYSVRGHNVAGFGPEQSLTVDASALPPSLSASATAATVILDITPSASLPVDPVTGYRIFKGSTQGGLVAIADTGVLPRWTGAAPAAGQTAWYAVATLSGTTQGALSTAVPVTGTTTQLVTSSDGAYSGTLRLRSTLDGRALDMAGAAYQTFPEDVAVSPNGTRVAYVITKYAYGQSSYGIAVRNADGSGTPLVLTDDAHVKGDLAWSPDGKTLAFAATDNDLVTTYLEIIPATGGQVGMILNSANLSGPSWLDSNTLVAEDDASGSAPLVTIGVYSGTRTTVPGTSAAILPSVRPDGTEIAFLLPAGPSHFDGLRILTRSTGAVRAVSAPASSYLTRPSWTRNGDRLYFVAGDATKDVFTVGTVAGAVFRNVTNTPNEIETSVAVSTPDTAAPASVKLGGIPAVTLGTTITPTFSATDAITGVGSYTVRYRRAGYNSAFGATSTMTTPTPKAIALARGYEYCFSVTATDRAGNTSAATPEQCAVVPLDDRSLARSSSFSAITGSGYYAATAVKATVKGATLSRSGVTSAKQLFLVATTCSTCGSVDVLIGTVKIASLSLVSSSTTNKRVLTLPAGVARTGTITIRVTSSGRTVIVDGVGIKK